MCESRAERKGHAHAPVQENKMTGGTLEERSTKRRALLRNATDTNTNGLRATEQPQGDESLANNNVRARESNHNKTDRG